MAFEPPFEAKSFDRVISSLLFHHLTTDDKRRTLAKLRELLSPGGELHVADWGKAQNLVMRLAFLGVQLLEDRPVLRSDDPDPVPGEAPHQLVSEASSTRRLMSAATEYLLYRCWCFFFFRSSQRPKRTMGFRFLKACSHPARSSDLSG